MYCLLLYACVWFKNPGLEWSHPSPQVPTRETGTHCPFASLHFLHSCQSDSRGGSRAGSFVWAASFSLRPFQVGGSFGVILPAPSSTAGLMRWSRSSAHTTEWGQSSFRSEAKTGKCCSVSQCSVAHLLLSPSRREFTECLGNTKQHHHGKAQPYNWNPIFRKWSNGSSVQRQSTLHSSPSLAHQAATAGKSWGLLMRCNYWLTACHWAKQRKSL